MTEQLGASWGRPAPKQQLITYIPHRFQANDFIQSQIKPVLPYGYGSSYGDVCLNQSGTLVSCRWLDKLISFDGESGRLHCEGGVSIGDIQQFAIKRGWCLPVSPGSQWVSVGGAIANDVHGKNHHRQGTFGRHVHHIKLVRSNGEIYDCSPKQHKDIFAATIGGLGLTGFIIEATLQLIPCSSNHLILEKVPFNSLSHFFELADEAEQDWEYTVAWLDCVTQKAGRGIFMRANIHSELISRKCPSEYDIPYPFGVNLIRRPVNRMLSSIVFHKNRYSKQTLEDYVRFFYPLDRIRHWSKFYGKHGMYQFQCVIPHPSRLEGMQVLLKKIQQSGLGGFLSVLKTFSQQSSPGLLSFPMPGVTLAVDFAANDAVRELITELTECVINFGGRIYSAKDALMSAESFRVSYPGLEKFLEYRDPGIHSNFSNRLIDGTGND